MPKLLQIGPLRLSPPVIQAPMAGFSNYAFRQMVRRFGGVGLQFTEMISAKGYAWLDHRGGELPDRLWGVADEPRPLGVQIWDNDPATLAHVAKRLVDEFCVSVIDVNFGCPVRQVAEKAKSGSYLLNDPRRIGQILERIVAAAAPTPVTAKIRLGRTRSQLTAPDVAHAVEESGAAALTVHGRVAEDYFRGEADWEQIAAIKLYLRRIPLIGNGDIQSAEDARRAFLQYGVDGIMIGRAGLGRPWLFSQVAAALAWEEVPPSPSLSEQRDHLLAHFDLIVQRFGPEKGVMLMRKYACCYAQGQFGARQFRAHAARVAGVAEFREIVDRYFPRDCSPAGAGEITR